MYSCTRINVNPYCYNISTCGCLNKGGGWAVRKIAVNSAVTHVIKLEERRGGSSKDERFEKLVLDDKGPISQRFERVLGGPAVELKLFNSVYDDRVYYEAQSDALVWVRVSRDQSHTLMIRRTLDDSGRDMTCLVTHKSMVTGIETTAKQWFQLVGPAQDDIDIVREIGRGVGNVFEAATLPPALIFDASLFHTVLATLDYHIQFVVQYEKLVGRGKYVALPVSDSLPLPSWACCGQTLLPVTTTTSSLKHMNLNPVMERQPEKSLTVAFPYKSAIDDEYCVFRHFNFVVGPDTDYLGWQYASNLKFTSPPSTSGQQYRRRLWMRSLVIPRHIGIAEERLHDTYESFASLPPLTPSRSSSLSPNNILKKGFIAEWSGRVFGWRSNRYLVLAGPLVHCYRVEVGAVVCGAEIVTDAKNVLLYSFPLTDCQISDGSDDSSKVKSVFVITSESYKRKQRIFKTESEAIKREWIDALTFQTVRLSRSAHFIPSITTLPFLKHLGNGVYMQSELFVEETTINRDSNDIPGSGSRRFAMKLCRLRETYLEIIDSRDHEHDPFEFAISLSACTYRDDDDDAMSFHLLDGASPDKAISVHFLAASEYMKREWELALRERLLSTVTDKGLLKQCNFAALECRVENDVQGAPCAATLFSRPTVAVSDRSGRSGRGIRSSSSSSSSKSNSSRMTQVGPPLSPVVILSMHRFGIQNPAIFHGFWAKKKMHRETFYRNRYIFIDVESSSLRWAKKGSPGQKSKGIPLLSTTKITESVQGWDICCSGGMHVQIMVDDDDIFNDCMCVMQKICSG
jgi:PH domain